MTTYYHVSQAKLPIGLDLQAKGSLMVVDRVAAFLEAVRPVANHLPRQESIFVVKEPIFTRLGVTYDAGFAHIVEATNVCGPYDLFWIGILQYRLDDSLDPRIRLGVLKRYLKYEGFSPEQIAQCYWSGTATEEARWEYSTSAAKVVGYWSDGPISLKGASNPVRI